MLRRLARNACVGLPQTRMSSPYVSTDVESSDAAALLPMSENGFPRDEREFAVVRREEEPVAEAVVPRIGPPPCEEREAREARSEASALNAEPGGTDEPGAVDCVPSEVTLPACAAPLSPPPPPWEEESLPRDPLRALPPRRSYEAPAPIEVSASRDCTS